MTTAANPKILFVDDDPNVLAAMQRNLRKHFALEVAMSGNAALEMLHSHGPFAVIVADMGMPVMNGVELLETVRVESPDTVRIMLTGNADQHTAAEAVNRGSVFRFLSKPCTTEGLAAVLDTALKQYELILTEKALLSQTLNGSLQVLTDILAMLDYDAFGMAQLRRLVAREVATKLRLQSIWDIEIAALLAEIGMVTLPPNVREKLRTHQSLLPNERQMVERVPEFSARLLANIPRMETVTQAVLYQHKNYDGSGFPADKVSGDSIPSGARVLRVVDAVVRMHRKGVALSEAINAVQAGPERYDQTVVRALSACGAVLRNKPQSAVPGMRSLPLADLAPGHVLISDITTSAGAVLMHAGTTLNATQLQRLRNFATLNHVVEPITVDIPNST